MIKRLGMLFMAALVVLTMMAVMAVSAMAAPITCPSGQTVVQTSPGTFECVNTGGNTSNAAHHQGTGEKV